MATILGTSGADRLIGTNSNDLFMGSPSSDVFEGLDGEDSVSYENSTRGLNIFMILSADATGDAAGDTMYSIENVYGTGYDDFIHGNDLNNKIYGLFGNDTLFGYRGNNQLFGGQGTDNLVGSSGIDFIDGGEGIDTLSYQLATGGITISMSDPSLNTGWAMGDTYINVEDVTGTMYADTIYGDDQPVNNLWGLAGDDHIYGGGGYDVMIGDAGADYLDGGEGTDMADYETADSPVIASLNDPSINTGHAKGDVYVSIQDIAGSRFDDILYGDYQNNGMDGWPGNDVLYGGPGNDGLSGNEGDDLLYGEADWDMIDGGSGHDTAGFHGPIANHKVWLSDGWINGQFFEGTIGHWMVADNVDGEGTDTLQSIESLRFSDMTVNLTVKQTAAGINSASLTLLQELYVAFFNRVPDADGLEFWINQYRDGQSIEAIAEIFYAAGVQASQVTGYSAGMSHADFVNKIYQNVLGRQDGADADGLKYWTGALISGSASRGSLVKSILQSAHTFKGNQEWGWVANLLDNKASVANTFAVQMGLGFLTPEESIGKGMEIAAAVTPDGIQAALELIGVTHSQIML